MALRDWISIAWWRSSGRAMAALPASAMASSIAVSVPLTAMVPALYLVEKLVGFGAEVRPHAHPGAVAAGVVDGDLAVGFGAVVVGVEAQFLGVEGALAPGAIVPGVDLAGQDHLLPAVEGVGFPGAQLPGGVVAGVAPRGEVRRLHLEAVVPIVVEPGAGAEGVGLDPVGVVLGGD